MKKTVFLFALLLSIQSIVLCQLKITSATNVTTTGNVHVVLNDMDLDNAGTLGAAGSNFHFTGTANSSVNCNACYITFNSLSINKPAGKQLVLNGSLYVNELVDFVSGNIDLKDQTIYLGDAGYFNNEAENSRAFSSTGGGAVNATRTLNAPNAVNIANLGATITANWNLGNVSVTRAHYSIDVLGNGSNSIKRSFEFNNSNAGNNNVLLTFKYFDAELNGKNENGLNLFQTPDNAHYTNRAFSARDQVSNSLTQTVSNMLSKFTLSDELASGALPVKIISFTAQCKISYIQLDWKTATEINSDRFDIQRSTNGADWNKIGSVKSKGNSNSLVAYQFDDNTLNTESAFYRLAQYDWDGKVTHSAIVKAGCGQSTEFKVMPNPVMDIARVVIGASTNSKGSLVLYNATGQLIMQQAITLTNGVNQFQINMAAMAKGNYNLVFMQSGNEPKNIKIIKQ